jgi:hypothetical protein
MRNCPNKMAYRNSSHKAKLYSQHVIPYFFCLLHSCLSVIYYSNRVHEESRKKGFGNKTNKKSFNFVFN